MSMRLQELLHDYLSTSLQTDCLIQDITNDSRKVKPGSLFIARKGFKENGCDFIDAAIANHAAAILFDPNTTEQILRHPSVPIIAIPNINVMQGSLAAKFYGNPSHHMQVIGVTGTSGKTSTTHFMAQLLQMQQHPCGIIGTLGFGFYPHLKYHQQNLTTPDPIELQKNLYELQNQGAKFIAMEVASHALDQHRVDGVKFAAAVFTQLSRDHLDYHGTMEAYGRTKMKLFQFPELRYGIVNADDVWGQKILHSAKHLELIAYSLSSTAMPGVKNIVTKFIKPLAHGYEVSVETPWGSGTFQTPLLGRFNISNLLAVLGVMGVLQIPLEQTFHHMTSLAHVKGRMEVLQRQGFPKVVVDFSHKPDALQNVLMVLREHCQGKLWCLFGCGGERDRGKRPQMAEIAEKYSDYVIVTSDNPRTENIRQIMDDIMAGFIHKDAVKIIVDRAAAIAFAMEHAKVEDVILLAGKGHEEYQIIGTEKKHFSDVEEVEQQFLKLKNR